MSSFLIATAAITKLFFRDKIVIFLDLYEKAVSTTLELIFRDLKNIDCDGRTR